MAEKVTVMKLKVDLECHKCYKKVKKVLAKFPQIRDEKFDEKQNIVTITVVCCSPEKIRDKLCYKGGGSIKSIEIVNPPKPEKKKDADDKPKAPAPDPPKKKDAAADKPKPKPADEPDKKKDAGDKEKPKDAAPKEKADKPKGDSEKPKGDPEKPKDKPAEAKPAPPPVKIADPVAAYPPAPQPMMVPVGICVTGYEGGPGPCVNGYAGPVMCYDGYYARPVYDSYGGGRPYYVNRCDQYFSDENPAGCTVM